MAEKFSLDDRPSVLALNEIKGRDGLNVIETIAANNYQTFGMYLLHDDNGQRVQLIVKGKTSAEDIVEGIIGKWLKQESQPVTYRYLVDCIKKSGMGAFAGEVQAMAVVKTTGATQLPTTAAAAAGVSSRPLTIDDLDEVSDAVDDLNDWMKLGLKLKIRHPALERIEKDQQSISQCKMKMMSLWLNQKDVSEKRVPTWSVLRDALERMKEYALADKIKNK